MTPNTPAPAPNPESSPRGEQLDHLCHHLGAREPFLLVIGEAGMGKTKLVRDAVARWGSRAAVAFVTNPALTRTELLEEILRRFGVAPPADASKPQLLACLEQRLAEVVENGQIPVIVVDDAHDLDDELLGELRLLTNTTVQADLSLTIVLSGLPHLETRLADPVHASLRQRVGAQCHVGPLTAQETRRYLHEIAGVGPGETAGPFARKACGEIFRRSGGSPPTIQALAEEAFRRAREAGSASVTTEHVQAAATSLKLGLAPDVAADEPIAEVPPKAPQKAIAPAASSATVRTPAPAPKANVASSPPAPAPRAAASPSAPSPTVTAPAASPAADPQLHASRPPVERRAVDSRPAEERRREWVERFIGADEPRFGSLLSVDLRSRAEVRNLVAADEAEAELRTQSEAPSPRVAKRGRGRSLRRGVRLPVRWPGALRMPHALPIPRAWLMPAAIGVLVMAAAFVFLRMPRTLTPPAPLDVEQVIAGASSSAPEPRAVAKPERAATPQQRHALDVGSYISSYRAEIERDRLMAETGLKGWVIEESDAGNISYRVVLGIYRTADRAEISASSLLSRGLIAEARVIPLPSRSKRR